MILFTRNLLATDGCGLHGSPRTSGVNPWTSKGEGLSCLSRVNAFKVADGSCCGYKLTQWHSQK